MAYNGVGVFARLYNWVADAAAGIKIKSDRMDAEMDGFRDGFTNAICKDGQSVCSARIPFAAGVSVFDGVVATPGISFLSDPDNGFYRIGANNWAGAQGGVKVIEFGGGCVMVGTNNVNPVGSNVDGISVDAVNHIVYASRMGGPTVVFGRGTNDGDVVQIYRQAVQVGSISVSAGATAYNTSSDGTLKENIKPASDVGHLIDAVVVSEFDWKESGEKQIAGFVAQDLLTTLAPDVPGLVNESDDGLLMYDPSKLVPMLFKEIQSLRGRLAAAGIP